MASSSISFKLQVPFFALVVLLLWVQTSLGGGIECENLNKDSCAFAISWSGKRCVLERVVQRKSLEETYFCRASEIVADHLKDWVETNQCIDACGISRTTLGISSDALLEFDFMHKLCSPSCYENCPNIVDLYFNLAMGEGVFLPKLCETRGSNQRRAMAEIQSSGSVAPGPEMVNLEAAPALAPAPEIENLEAGPALPPAFF